MINHADLSKLRTAKHEEDILAIMELLQNNWINLVDTDIGDCVSLSTGVASSQAIVSDLLGDKKKGEEAYKNFVQAWLENSKQKFHDKMSKLNLKTFADLTKTGLV